MIETLKKFGGKKLGGLILIAVIIIAFGFVVFAGVIRLEGVCYWSMRRGFMLDVGTK